MSQRLLVTTNPRKYEDVYDALIHNEMNENEIFREIEYKWLDRNGGMWFGPWKVRIEDINVFKLAEPFIQSVFADIGEVYPDCVWVFYKDRKTIEHPSQAELGDFLA